MTKLERQRELADAEDELAGLQRQRERAEAEVRGIGGSIIRQARLVERLAAALDEETA